MVIMDGEARYSRYGESSRSGVWGCKDGCNAAVVKTGQRQSPGWNRALRRVLAPSSLHSHSYSSTKYAQAAAAAGISSSSPFTSISCRAAHSRLACMINTLRPKTSALILLHHSPSPLRTHPGSAQFPHQSVAVKA